MIKQTRRWIVGAVLLTVSSACVASPPPVEDITPALEALAELELTDSAARAVLRRAQEVTVRIRTLGCRQLGVGSGFVLPGGIVVTNRHVVDQPRSVTVNTWDGRSLEADISGVAVDSDLAILQLADDAGLPVAQLRTTSIEVGEAIVVVGYPGGGPATVTTGKVVGLVDGEVLGEAAGVLRIDAEIRQGNSGGPVLDQDGLVIGVVFAIETDSGMGLAVPVATLMERLDVSRLAAPTGC
ncbi:MAG: serine protease [Nitriliruptoraceae bacterium]